MTYETARARVSGEVYAVERDADGRITRAAGPLHHEEPTDPDSLRDYLDNQPSGEAEDAAEWMTEWEAPHI